MRLLPAQIGMRLLCGMALRPRAFRDQSLAERIREGREFLARITRVDLGYDPIAWHEHLCATKAGGYAWGRREGIPRMIQAALTNQDWVQAVAVLTAQDV